MEKNSRKNKDSWVGDKQAWVARYGLAVVLAAAGLGLRLALTAWIGPGLPTYITFYPAVMAAALLGGFGPGFLALVIASLAVEFFVLPPTGQFEIVSTVNRAASVLFAGMGLFLSIVAELYRRNRDKAATYDKESALRETFRQKEFLAGLLENAEQPFVVGYPDGRIGFFNCAYEKLTGYTAAELRAIDWSSSLTPPEWREPEKQKIEELHRSGQPVRYEKEYLRKDGSHVPVELFVHLKHDADGKPEFYYCFLIDTTERKKLEEALKKNNEILEERVLARTQQLASERQRLYSVLETLPAYVVLLDKDYRVRFANKFFRERFGESHGKRCYEYLFNRTEPCENCESYKAMKTGQKHHWEWLGPDGRNYDIYDFPFTDIDGSRMVMEMGIDITETKKAQEALSMANEALEARVAERTAALEESEQRVRRKLDSVLSPEGNIGDLELSDIIDAEKIQVLMDDFYKLSHVPMAIIDLKGKTLVGVGWQDVCTKFHRIHPETCKFCVESDTELTAAFKPGEFELYKCKNHMWDAATPLIIGNKKFGNIFIGQFFFESEKIDYDLFRVQAKRYGFDEESYIAALDAAPRLTKASLEASMAFLMKIAHMISTLSFSNVELARIVAVRDDILRSLRASEQNLARAQEIAHLGSWEMDLVTNRLTWSDEVYRIFGLPPQEFNATYEAFLDRVHPEDRAAVDAAYTGSVREGRDSYEIEHRVIRKDTGEIRIIHERCQHSRDNAGKIVRSVGMVHDITDRKKAEEVMARERANLQTIFNTVNVGMLLLNEAGVVQRANNVISRWIGKEPGEISHVQPGNMLGCIYALGDPAGCGHTPHCHTCSIRKTFEAVLSSGQPLHDVETEVKFLIGSDQVHLHLSLSADPVVIDGKRHVILSMNNITERKKAEEALIELADAKSRFAATVSHELRSPLATIKAITELVSDGLVGPVNDAQKDLLATAKTSISRLGRLTNNVLAFKKMEAGKMRLELLENDIHEVIREAYKDAVLFAGDRKADLSMDLGNDLPKIKFDRDKILQVLINLISNAVKYSEKGTVAIWMRRENNEIHVSVRDSGPGIKVEHLERIFEPFVQLGDNKQRGTGLGLSIVKEIILAHHGQIWVAAEAGKGSTFHFTLPI